MAVKRFVIVPPNSSAAKMPLPGATIAFATRFNSARSMIHSVRPGEMFRWALV